MERILLQTLNADLEVELPYKYIHIFVQRLKSNEKEKYIIQYAWNFLNDRYVLFLISWFPSLGTTLQHLQKTNKILYKFKPMKKCLQKKDNLHEQTEANEYQN